MHRMSNKIDRSEYCVVFDFDGTVMASNLGYEFFIWMIRQSLLRHCVAWLLSPFALLLMSNIHTIKWGMNIGCCIATIGQRRNLFMLRSEFIDYYFASGKAPVFSDAMTIINQYLARGEKILIISGSHEWILWGVIKFLKLNNGSVAVIGSSQRMSVFGSQVLDRHCYGENKLAMAKARGFDSDDWQYAYSDCLSDSTMLNASKKAFIINAKVKNFKKLQRRITVPFEMLNWH